MLKKNKWKIVILVVFVGLIAFYVNRPEPPKLVEKINLERVKVKKTVSANGEVKSNKEADLSFAVTGRLTNLTVSKNERVTKGQYLASLYNLPNVNSINAARDARDIAKKELELFIENYETNQERFGGKDEYNIELSRKKEILNRAENLYKAELSGLTNYYIYAPIDGTVVDTYYDIGEVVTATSTVIKLADLNDLIFEISLDQEDFGLVREGMVVNIKLDSYDEEIFKGVVYEMPNYALDSGDFLVKIKFDNTNDKNILQGMKGDADILVAETEGEVDALVFDTIYTDDSGNFVYIDNNGRVEKFYIETGLEGDIYTEIKSNLSEFTLVVPKSDSVELNEGDAIKVVGDE